MEKNMNDFWKSYDITHAELGPNFRCYPLYGKIHLIELALSLVSVSYTHLTLPTICSV